MFNNAVRQGLTDDGVRDDGGHDGDDHGDEDHDALGHDTWGHNNEDVGPNIRKREVAAGQRWAHGAALPKQWVRRKPDSGRLPGP